MRLFRTRSSLVLALVGLVVLLGAAAPVYRAIGGDSNAEERARRMFLRLCHSISGADDEAVIAQMASLLSVGNDEAAAALATHHKKWVNDEVRQAFAGLASRTGSGAVQLGSVQALVMLVAQKGVEGDTNLGDFRQILTADFGARIKASAAVAGEALPAVDYRNDRSHWQYGEKYNLSWADVLEPVRPQVVPYRMEGNPAVRYDEVHRVEAAGILTLHQWVVNNFTAGTHRKVFHTIAREFLGLKGIEELWDNSLGSFHVGHDISRANYSNFTGNCQGCHEIMDAARAAFCFLNASGGQMEWRDSIAPQFSRNESVFPDAWDIRDLTLPEEQDLWVWQATEHQNAALGWRGALSGKGTNEFGRLIANSRAFSITMAKRVFVRVCKRYPIAGEVATLSELSLTKFEGANYFLHRLYEAVAALPGCIP